MLWSVPVAKWEDSPLPPRENTWQPFEKWYSSPPWNSSHTLCISIIPELIPNSLSFLLSLPQNMCSHNCIWLILALYFVSFAIYWFFSWSQFSWKYESGAMLYHLFVPSGSSTYTEHNQGMMKNNLIPDILTMELCNLTCQISQSTGNLEKLWQQQLSNDVIVAWKKWCYS